MPGVASLLRPLPLATRRRTWPRWLLVLVALVGLLGACSTDQPGEEDTPPQAVPDEAPEPAPLPDEPPDAAPEPVEPPPAPPPEPVEPPPPPPPPPPASREALTARAQALLRDAREDADGGDFSLLVVDEHGREVVAHRPDDDLLPASTLKLVTAAAALSTFGPEASFRTRVEVTGPVDSDGVLHGDLVLVGSGDPVLATEEYGRWVYPARPRTPIEELARAVVDAGVREIRGDVVGVADRFDGPNVADGWPDRYFSSLDARYADGLSIDAGLRTLVSYPEPDPDDGDPDGDDEEADDVEPSEDREAGEGQDTTSDGSDVDDAPPPDVDPIVRVDHAPDPGAHAAAEFARLLADHEVVLRGETRAGIPAGTIVGRLATIESPPMGELLRFAVQRSDNQIADALFRAVGRARTGTGSFASGDRALRQVLDRYGVDHDGAHFADGSGLSRDDRASARMLVELDRAMLRSRHATTWRSLMAVTGRVGTLETRLSGTVADGHFFGKTGTLRDVSALVGTAHVQGPRRYHLAVIANDDGAARWVSRTLADELIVLLVADLRD